MLILFTLMRLLFFVFNSSFFGSLNTSEWLQILKGGIRFDIVAVLYLNIIYILMMLVPGSFKNNRTYIKTSNYIFVITNSLGVIANCVDFAYYQFNLKRIIYPIILEWGNLNNVNNLAKSFFIDYPQVWLLSLFFIACLIVVNKFFCVKSNSIDNHGQFDLFFVSIFFIVAGVRGGDLRHASRPIGISHAGEYVTTPNQVALVLNTPFSIFKTLGKLKEKRITFFNSNQELEAVFKPVYNITSKGDFRNKNVIIFIIESYSEEASGYVNKDKRTGGFTPFLDSLRNHGYSSNNTFANGKKSIEALPALLCGIPSLEEPFILSSYGSNSINGLPQYLESKNYHTSFFHGAPNGSMGFQAFTNIIGVKNYYGKDEFADDSQYDNVWGIWDEPFLQYAHKTISTFPEPFMSAIFTLSSHDPFKIPEKYNGKFKEGPHPIYETLSYTDMAIRNFFEKAKNEAWFRNTLFVFTGDHTSSHATLPEFSTSLGRFRVPIFFYSPENDLPESNSKNIIQQTDICPSILAYLNFDRPVFSFGRNVFDKQSQGFTVNHFGAYQFIQNDYLITFDGDKTTGLFNFAKDKLLNKNIISINIDLKQKLEVKLKAYLQQYNNRMLDNRLTIK